MGLVFLSILIQIGGNSQTRVERLDSLMLHLYNTNQFLGSVLVIESDSTIYKKSLGWADFEKRDTLTNSTPINLASISKHFTATAVLLLVQEGKISLTDEITDYIPELSYDNILIEHLLYHTSGIKDYEGISAVFTRKGDFMDNSALVKLYAEKDKKLKFEPGEKYKYSNTGYVLLATIVERVSKMTFTEFVEQNIFSSSKFLDTYVYNINQHYESIAWSYTPSYKRADQTRSGKHFSYYDAITGDGAICISNNDMEKWAKLLNDKGIIADSLFDQSITSGLLNNGDSTHYGYGWDLIEGNYGHTGGWHNFATYYFKDVHNNRVYSVNMTNNPKNWDAILWAIRDVIEGKLNPFPLPVRNQKRKQTLFEKKYKIEYLKL